MKSTVTFAMAVLLAASQVFAGEPKVTFEQSGGSVKSVIQEAKQNASAAQVPGVVIVTAGKESAVPSDSDGRSVRELLPISVLLKGASLADKIAFLDRQTKAGEKAASLAIPDLLSGASPEAMQEFVDSIVLLDGKIGSVSTALLTQELGPARVHEILIRVFERQGSRRPHTTALCNEHYCYDTICTGTNQGHGCRDSTSNSCGNGC